MNEMWRNDMINIYIYIYSWHFNIRTGLKLNAILMVHIYQTLMAYDWNNGIFIPDFVMYTLHSMATAMFKNG